MATWRCPHCGTPQAETSRCWVCTKSPLTCSTCRHFRKGVAGRLGFCAMDRRRQAMTGEEIRPCWQAPAAAAEPLEGLFRDLASTPRSADGELVAVMATEARESPGSSDQAGPGGRAVLAADPGPRNGSLAPAELAAGSAAPTPPPPPSPAARAASASLGGARRLLALAIRPDELRDARAGWGRGREGRLVDAPPVPPSGHLLSVADQLRRAEWHRRQRSRPDGELLPVGEGDEAVR